MWVRPWERTEAPRRIGGIPLDASGVRRLFGAAHPHLKPTSPSLMPAPAQPPPAAPPDIVEDRSFFGHPRGLGTLFFVEMWELLSYYGLRPVLILFMTAALIDNFVDFILVGDSLGMVMHGLETTVPVTLDMMILQGKAVMRGSKRALVVVDMPFGSYEESPAAAFRSAARIMKETGCGAIKLEGGRHMAETVRFLADRGIPVMGHVGLTPQSFNTLGGFKIQGRTAEAAMKILEDALAIQDAGCFMLEFEAVPGPIATLISRQLEIPTIGIGAGVGTDGQILLCYDLLGVFTDFKPKFTKRFANLTEVAVTGISQYVREVKEGTFPDDDHTYGVSDAEYERFATMVEGRKQV